MGQTLAGKEIGTYSQRTKTIEFRYALNEALREEMERDERVIVIGEDIGFKGGSFKVTEGLLDIFGPERILSTPISESIIIGSGLGAALNGMRPVVEISFIDFTMLAMDQIVNQVAKFKFMSGGRAEVPLVIRTQGGGGKGIAAQHSQSLEAMFFHVPGLKIVMPSGPYDAKGLLKTAIRDDEPVVFIEHKMLYLMKGEIPEEEYLLPIGKGVIERKGSDVTVVATSLMVQRVLEASEILSEQAIEVEVVNPRSLVPLDLNLILESVKKTGKAMIVHEACQRGGIGGELAALIMEHAFDYLDRPVRRLGGINTPIPYNAILEDVCIPDTKRIVQAISELCG